MLGFNYFTFRKNGVGMVMRRRRRRKMMRSMQST